MQATLGDIDPNETSGTELAVMLTQFGKAIESGHRGATRPSYLAAGGAWVQDLGGSTYNFCIYDGDADIVIGVVNKATNTFVANTTPPTLSALGGVPDSRAVSTGGSLAGGGGLSTNRTLTLLNDNATPGATRYYGTDGGGTKGFHAFPTQPKGQPVFAAFGPGTHYWTCPTGVTRAMAQVYAAAGGGFIRADGDPTIGLIRPRGLGGRATVNLFNLSPGFTYQFDVGQGGSAYDITLYGPSESPDWYTGNGGDTHLHGFCYLTGGQGMNPFGVGAAPGTIASVGSNATALWEAPDMKSANGEAYGVTRGGLITLWYWI